MLDEEDLEYGSEEENEEDDSSIESNNVMSEGEKQTKQSPGNAEESKKKKKRFPKLITNSEKINMNLIRSKSAPLSSQLKLSDLLSVQERKLVGRRHGKKPVPPTKFLCNLSADYINFCHERKARFYKRTRVQDKAEKNTKQVGIGGVKQTKQKKASSKHKLMIKGSFAGNPYKVFKNSKFISNTEKINHKLH